MPVFLSLVFFSMHESYALGINLFKKILSVICLTQKLWIFLGNQSMFQDWNQYFMIEMRLENWCFCSTVHTQNLPHTLSFSTPPHIYLLLYMSLPTYHPYCCKTICRLSLNKKNLLKFKKHNFFVRRKSAQIVWWKKKLKRLK